MSDEEVDFNKYYKPNSKFKVKLLWKDKISNRAGVYETELESDEEGLLEFFIWNEGNYSCDCNRAILFLGYEYDHKEPNYACNTSNIDIEKVLFYE